MTLEEAKSAVGKMVITTHAGPKMIKHGPPHGPYLLLKVTKGGLCILDGYQEYHVTPTQITIWMENLTREQAEAIRDTFP